MGSEYEQWEEIYRGNSLEALPWERGKPRESLVELVEGGEVRPGRALDTCCGMGTNDVYLAQKGFQVTALDISTTAVEHAKRKAREAGVDIVFMVRSFLDLPFDKDAFDFVFDSGCFHHVRIEDRTAYINGVHRVLAPGGRYLLICFSDHNGPAWNHFTVEQLRGLFSEHFNIVLMKHFGTVEGDGAVRYFHNVLMEKAG